MSISLCTTATNTITVVALNKRQKIVNFLRYFFERRKRTAF